MVTVSGDLTALQTPPVTRVISPIFASNPVSARQISSREFQLLFSVNVAANSILKISFETFRLPSTSSPGSDAVEAALVDADGNVFAPSSTGSYPAIFAKTTSGSSVGLSSSVANAVPLAPKVRIAINPVLYDAHIVQLARTAQPRPRHRPSRVPYAPLAHSATTQEQLTFQRALNVCRGRKARR